VIRLEVCYTWSRWNFRLSVAVLSVASSSWCEVLTGSRTVPSRRDIHLVCVCHRTIQILYYHAEGNSKPCWISTDAVVVVVTSMYYFRKKTRFLIFVLSHRSIVRNFNCNKGLVKVLRAFLVKQLCILSPHIQWEHLCGQGFMPVVLDCYLEPGSVTKVCGILMNLTSS